MKRILGITALVMSASLICMSGAAFAGETETSAEAVVETTADAVETKDIQLNVTNKTGKTIEFISVEEFSDSYDENALIVRMQEALIEQGYLDDVADGEYGPISKQAVADFRAAKNLSADGDIDNEMLTLLFGTYDDGNLLKDNATLKADESATLCYTPAESETAEEKEETESAKELKESLESTGIVPEYIAVVKFEDDDTEYILHVFYVNDIENINILKDGDIVYIEYKVKDGDTVSTLDAEKAVYDYEHPVVEYNDYDDYSDYGYYDYADDAVYSVDDTPAQGGDGCVEDPLFYDDNAAQSGDGCIEDGLFYDDSAAQGGDGCIEDGLFYDDSAAQGADGCIEDGLFY